MNKYQKIIARLFILANILNVTNSQTVSSKYMINGFENIINYNDSRNIIVAGLVMSRLGYNYDYYLQEMNETKNIMPKNLARFGDYWGITNQFILWSSISGIYSAEQKRYAMNAFLVNGIVTYSIKFATMRRRPDRSNKRSYPSGHTSNSFLGATIIQNIYGSDIGIPAYLLASITGMSRINDNKHYLSDVIFGAALGVGIGKAFNHLYEEEIMKIDESIPRTSFKLNYSWTF